MFTAKSGALLTDSQAEWWTERIQPWVHYVPVLIDYSEVYDVLSFVSRHSDTLGYGLNYASSEAIFTVGQVKTP